MRIIQVRKSNKNNLDSVYTFVTDIKCLVRRLSWYAVLEKAGICRT